MKNPPRLRPGSGPGFTLIELLVVLVILVILAALIFPFVSSARLDAQRAASAKNLRTIFTLAGLYSADHEGFAVPYESSEWGGAEPRGYLYVFEYLPLHYGEGSSGFFKRPGDRRGFSYARNIALPQKKGVMRDDGKPTRLDLSFKSAILPSPSRTMYFIETKGNGGLTPAHVLRGDVYFHKEGPSGKSGVLFLDGHVEFLPWDFLVGNDAGSPGSWSAERRLLWFGYPDAGARRDY